MNSYQAKQLNLPDLMGRLGYEPTSIKKEGKEYWYLSPFRKEKDASVHTSFLGGKWIWNVAVPLSEALYYTREGTTLPVPADRNIQIRHDGEVVLKGQLGTLLGNSAVDLDSGSKQHLCCAIPALCECRSSHGHASAPPHHRRFSIQTRTPLCWRT